MLYLKDFCDLLEEVQNAKDLQSKSNKFKKGFEKFRQDSNFTVQSNYETFYQAIRLILPGMDHERKSFNMKESKIATNISKMLSLPDGPDRRNLRNFNKVQNAEFAEIVHSVLRKYITSKPSTLTVSELNQNLDAIANRDSDTQLDNIMLPMFRKLTNVECKWVIRIMLKKLKLGIDNNRILNIFHKDAVEFYNSNHNLKKVCETLWDPSIKLTELNIKMFESFQPMLSKRTDANSFTKDFPDKKIFLIENKFDGERFQLHMENGIFKYYSRNGFDYTVKFGETYSSGILTPKLKGVFNENVNKIILDGEMMLWNTKVRKFGSKGMSFDVKKLKNYGYYQPCFCVFDILLLNDDVLANKELQYRLELLRKAISKTIDGVIILSFYEKCTSRQEIIQKLNKSMDNEQEGIIVKDPQSFYKLGCRTGGWYKIKMEYFDDVVNDLDLILMGAFYKSNSDEFNSFLVGVFSGDAGRTVLAMGRVSTGLNFEETKHVNDKLKDKGHPYAQFSSKTNGCLIFGKEVPDIFIEPEKSLIFTIRATELIRSTSDAFRTPYTLRFPRILKVRDDKLFTECLSINELLELCQQNKSVIKLNKRHLKLEEIQSVKKRKKSKKLIINSDFVGEVSNCLGGLKFYVLSDTPNSSIDKIEGLITKLGGNLTLTLEDSVNIVLSLSVTHKVRELMKRENKFDIIRTDWIERVSDANQLLKYNQNEVLSIGTSYYNCLADDVDMYGDSYTDELTIDTLKERLDLMAEREYCINLNESIFFKQDLFLFNKLVAYFDAHEVINDPTSKIIYDSFLDEIEFKYRKGLVASLLGPEVDFIVVKSGNQWRKSLLEDYSRSIHCRNIKVIINSQLYHKEEL